MSHTIGIPVIGGSHWLGGWNYMINMVETLAEFGPESFRVCILAGTDIAHPDLERLDALARTRVIHDKRLNAEGKAARLRQALLTGLDRPAWEVFRANGIDCLFESASFHGWRLPIPTIAWVPDFQHRRLPRYFTWFAWLRRELGLRAQFASRRRVMLSSRAAEKDCVELYPQTRGRTEVVPFAVASPAGPSAARAIARAREFGLPDRFFFLANQLWGHKNHALAIEAAAILKQRGDDGLIVATAQGRDHRAPRLREMLDAKIHALGVEDKFLFLGDLAYSDVRLLALCCSAIVNPSRFEGWSTAVEEAKASGTPLILSNIDVHLEQAPGAAFFDPDEPAQLANCIYSAPARSEGEIERARTRAAAENVRRRMEFATKFASMVAASVGS